MLLQSALQVSCKLFALGPPCQKLLAKQTLATDVGATSHLELKTVTVGHLHKVEHNCNCISGAKSSARRSELLSPFETAEGLASLHLSLSLSLCLPSIIFPSFGFGSLDPFALPGEVVFSRDLLGWPRPGPKHPKFQGQFGAQLAFRNKTQASPKEQI